VTTNHRADHHRSNWFARLLLGLLIVAAAGYTASFPVAAASPLQADPSDAEPPPSTVAPDEEQGIIPEPNSGHEPREAGDRGGALQLLLLAVIVTGVGVIAGFVVRESRRNLAARGS
jgi:hypothetical protein